MGGSRNYYVAANLLPTTVAGVKTQLVYCSLQVGCHSQWFMLDSVVSTVDTVWLTLAIHGFSALRNRYHMSLIAHANSCALSQASSSCVYCGAVALQDWFQQKQLANSDGIGIRAYALRLT